MSQPELPDAVYVQEDLEEPTLSGFSKYIVYIIGALIAGITFSTQYFALLVGFADRLIVLGGAPVTPDPSIVKTYRLLAITLGTCGVLGFPVGFWYSKQPKTLRFRAFAAFSLILLAAAPLLWGFSFERRYAFWEFAVWVYHYHDDGLLRPLLWSGGLGFLVALSGFLGLVLGTTGQVFDISGAYGSAHWGDGEWFAEGTPHTSSGKMLSQADDWGVPIGWRGKRMLFDREGLHTYVQAPTGSGKTVGFVVPTLLMHPGSLLAIDIKRELYFVSARRRDDLNSDVYRLDPFAEDIDPARYNPLDLIDTSPVESGDGTAIDDARSIANTLVVKDQGSNQNPFFIDSARQLLFGLIMYVCATEDQESGDRHLGTVRELLMQPNGNFQDGPPEEGTLRRLLSDMGQFSENGDISVGETCSKGCARIIEEQGNQFAQMGTKEFSSVASTARTQTEFLSSPHIQDAISETTFRFKEMQTKEDGISVFLSLPADRLGDYYRWLRLMIISARTEIIRLEAGVRQNTHPSLFMIEEAPRLGRMEAINEGLSLDRGYGIQYMIVAQSYNQLKDAYGEELANNILANCRLKMMWGAATNDDAKMISDLCGETTVAFETSNKSRSQSSGEGGTQKSVSESIQEQSRALVTPDEVSRVPEDWTFVFTRGEAPLLVRRPNYVQDEEVFNDLPDPHPEYSTDDEFQQARKVRVKRGIERPPQDGGTAGSGYVSPSGGDGAASSPSSFSGGSSRSSSPSDTLSDLGIVEGEVANDTTYEGSREAPYSGSQRAPESPFSYDDDNVLGSSGSDALSDLSREEIMRERRQSSER
jgi:type IV secretion system protein VirD4